MTKELLDISSKKAVAETPALIVDGGSAAQFAYDEFIYARIRNRYTRRNYRHAAERFLSWCGERGLSLNSISPRHVGEYIDGLTYAPATKKLHLAAIRHLFDELVNRHVVVLNPAASVRGMRYQVVEGKTPEITTQQARQLLKSIDISTPIGLRDRAVIGILIYTAARIGAVAKLQWRNLSLRGTQYVFRFEEKNGKSREIPVRHDLVEFLLSYQTIVAAELRTSNCPIFVTFFGRTGRPTGNPMTANDMSRMIDRRLKGAGLPSHLSAHSFRVATITNLLEQGVSLSDVQRLAGHSDPRTTRLYDRRSQMITRNLVERISI